MGITRLYYDRGIMSILMNIDDIHKKFEAFNWHVQSIDGHKVQAIEEAIKFAKDAKGLPSVIILNTKKGKCCNYAEDVLDNHHMNVFMEDTAKAVAELEDMLAKY